MERTWALVRRGNGQDGHGACFWSKPIVPIPVRLKPNILQETVFGHDPHFGRFLCLCCGLVSPQWNPPVFVVVTSPHFFYWFSLLLVVKISKLLFYPILPLRYLFICFNIQVLSRLCFQTSLQENLDEISMMGNTMGFLWISHFHSTPTKVFAELGWMKNYMTLFAEPSSFCSIHLITLLNQKYIVQSC